MKRRTLLILTLPRSGSHLLASLMHANGVAPVMVGNSWEPLSCLMVPKHRMSRRDLAAHYRNLADGARNEDGWALVKTNVAELAELMAFHGFVGERDAFLASAFGECSRILLDRMDLQAQAVSLSFAISSRCYKSTDAPGPDPPYDYDKIRRLEQSLIAKHVGMAAAKTAGCMRFSYEDLITYPADCLLSISRATGISLPIAAQDKIQRMASPEKTAQVAMYREERLRKIKTTEWLD